MKKFNRGRGFGKNNFTRPRDGARKFSGGGFRRPGTSEGGDRSEARKLFTASCSVCGAQCQVPFRPHGSRPIYCQDCFCKHGEEGSHQRFQQKERSPQSPSPFRREESAAAGSDQGNMLRLLEKMNQKLDRILEAVEGEEE